MNELKKSFIELCLDCDVLKFGSFELKSGRISPYFFNAGLFYDGHALKKLGDFYAKTILDANLDFDHLFGPAYKGLPLATTVSVSLAQHGVNKTVTFNRKEAKDHGEGGQLIGAPMHGNTVVIDDVITAGTAFREAKTMIEANNGIVSAVVIALDRCESGLTQQSAIDEIKAQGISVLSIITVHEIIGYLEEANQIEQAEIIKGYVADHH